MRDYRWFVVILILSNSLLFTGCARDGNSRGIHVERACSTEVIEHTMPFEVYNDLPLVNCSLNGNKAVPFLVDTGASTNVLDYEYAKAIGVLPTSEEYRSLQGVPTLDTSIDDLKIGTLELEKVCARLIDLKDVLPGDCPAKGILGYPVFRQLEICVDYPKRTISLREGANRKLNLSFNPVFTFVIVPVLVENQGPFNFIFDTGSDKSLVEPHILQELNPSKKGVPVVRIKVDGTGEGFAWPRPRKDSRSDEIGDAREFVRRACGVRIDGVLGWRHMKDYKVVVNYPTCTYQFEKTGYPPELKPVIVDVLPDISKDINSAVKEIVFEFSVPMRQYASYLTTFECDHHWQDDKHLKLIILEELEVDKEYEIILEQGFRSKKDVPLDWSPYRFRVVSSHSETTCRQKVTLNDSGNIGFLQTRNHIIHLETGSKFSSSVGFCFLEKVFPR
jgi:hypothetical protein